MTPTLDPSTHRTTVGSLLHLEIFRRARAFVAAGEEHLHRPVRWVHSGEIPDISRFLAGGELLLTAGHGVGLSESDQRRYIASIARVGVAAVAIELAGRVFTELPPAVVHEASLHGLPLIGLPVEIPFVEVSAQVLELLSDNTVREFERSAELNRFLTTRLLGGADYISLVRDIAMNLGRAVVLESGAHQVLAYYGDSPAVREFLSDWPVHSRSVQSHADGSGRSCTSLPIVVQGTPWGWLHMPDVESGSSMDRVLLEQGGSAIAISLLTERVSGARRAHHQGVLINRLMLGDISGDGFLERALRIGRDLRQSRLIIAIADATPRGDLEAEISANLARNHLTAVTADIGEGVLSVIALRGDRSLGLAVKALSNDARVIGFSKVVSPGELRSAVGQARAAFSARQPTQFFDQLGLLRLLVPLAAGPDLAAFVEDELGRLVAYDTAHDNTLLPTLATYFECDGNKTDTAKRLFVQRRTLYYRLEKLEQILGTNLDDPDVRLNLQVAIRGLELLRDAARGSITAPAPDRGPR